MLTEQVEVDQITVLLDGQIQVRQTTKILRDGVEISRTLPHRHVVIPGHPLDSEDPRVRAIGQVIHTPIVVATFQVVNAEKDFQDQERHHTAIVNRFRELSAEEQADPENIALLDASRERLAASSSALAEAQRILEALT